MAKNSEQFNIHTEMPKTAYGRSGIRSRGFNASTAEEADKIHESLVQQLRDIGLAGHVVVTLDGSKETKVSEA
jgi:hypothetical protein